MFAIKRYVRARRPSRFLAAEVILDVGTPTRLFRSHDFGVVTFDGLLSFGSAAGCDLGLKCA
jgi:hypothetical protein